MSITTRPMPQLPPALAGTGRAVAWVAVRVYPVVLLLGAWQLLGMLGLVGNEFVLPPPARVAEAGRRLVEEGTLQGEALVTLRRILGSFALAVVVGVGVGLLIGRVAVARLALRPLVSFLFPIPKVAIYPAMFLLLGLGTASKVALGFAEAVFPVLLATAAATSQVEPRLLWSAEALGTRRRALPAKVVLPAALPGILTGARVGMIGAVIGVFLAELITASDGLGHGMSVSSRLLHIPDTYVRLVAISVLGFALDRTVLLTRRHLLAWSPEQGH